MVGERAELKPEEFWQDVVASTDIKLRYDLMTKYYDTFDGCTTIPNFIHYSIEINEDFDSRMRQSNVVECKMYRYENEDDMAKALIMYKLQSKIMYLMIIGEQKGKILLRMGMI